MYCKTKPDLFFLFCFTSKQHERTEENLQQTYKNMEIFVAANNKVGISKALFEQMSVKLTFIDKWGNRMGI